MTEAERARKKGPAKRVLAVRARRTSSSLFDADLRHLGKTHDRCDRDGDRTLAKRSGLQGGGGVNNNAGDCISVGVALLGATAHATIWQRAATAPRIRS